MQNMAIILIIVGRSASFFDTQNFRLNVLVPLQRMSLLHGSLLGVDCTDSGVMGTHVNCVDATANAKNQFERWDACWQCTVASVAKPLREDTIVVRVRPDVTFFEPLTPAHVAPALGQQGCLVTRFRAARGYGLLNSSLFSYHFHNSNCEQEGCTGLCSKCLTIDDQMAVMNVSIAPLYFESKSRHTTDSIVSSYVRSRGCPSGIWPEHIVSRVVAAHGVCVRPLDLQFRLTRDLAQETTKRENDVNKNC